MPLYSNNTSQPELIFSAGNEQLTIDNIVFFSGDSSSFTIDYASLQDIIVPEGDSFSFPVIFYPTTPGEHYIQLQVTHDANPNYQRTTSLVTISGFCGTDNKDLFSDILIDILPSCQTTPADLIIKNNGEAKIEIDSISIKSTPSEVQTYISPLPTYPITLNSNETVNIPVHVFIEKSNNAEMVVDIGYNSGSNYIFAKQITPTISTIKSVFQSSSTNLTPGDTLTLLCRAEISNKSELPLEQQVTLEFNKKLFFCLDTTCQQVLIDGNNNTSPPITIKQYANYIQFDLSDVPFLITSDNSIIEFQLRFLTLLSPEKTDNVIFELKSERCYNSTPTLQTLTILPICADAVRTSVVFDKFAYWEVRTEDYNSEIEVIINLLADDTIDLFLNDLLGNKV